MEKGAILAFSLAIALTAACGPGDPPESIRFGGNPRSGTAPPSSPPVPPPLDPGGEVGTFSEKVVEADPAPLPIAGGTLAILAQGTKAAIADPDHDQVVVIDLEKMAVVTTTPLAIGDDPGRLVEDGAGRLHVALRAGRGVAVIDPTAGVLLGRLPVCPQPRGLAYDYFSDTVHVACAGGELVSYTASNGTPVRRFQLDRDLRDVVVDGERLLVSRFRSAELLVVEGDGTISSRLLPVATDPFNQTLMKAAVAWRTIAAPGGGAYMVHQLVTVTPIGTSEGGYGGKCRHIVSSAVSLLRHDQGGWRVDSIPAVLPVDVAVTGDAGRLVVPSAGHNRHVNLGESMPYVVFSPPREPQMSLAPCGGIVPMPALPGGTPDPEGRVVAVAFDPGGRLALQTRVPNMFHLGSRSVQLPGRSRRHTGHELFHLATASGIACASCHPEGREDGHVWTFSGFGPRRTQSLAGGISGTEPFHWAGDMSTFAALAADVFLSRMSGPLVQTEHVSSLLKWIDTIPRMAAPPATDTGAVQRGQSLFNDPAVGCATCHSGARLTNNKSMNVDTGASFQVPSLRGLAWRAPYMHDGCAQSLADRFGSCGGGDVHGQTSQLTVGQRADLIAYLETL